MDDRPTRFLPADENAVPLRPRRRSAWRQAGLILLVLVVLAGAAWLLKPGPSSKPPGGRFAQGGPMPVVGAPAVTGDMPVILNGLGTVTPLATVTVKTQINGQITEIAFKEGQTVKPGDFLVQIDPRPYQVALEQAQGTLARDQALLANAKVDLARYQKLFAEDSIAEQQLATQRALVSQDEATIKVDEGVVDASKLNLVYCHITAPVGGRVGLRQVDLGNYVTPGDANGIVVITTLQPITVVFTLPEDDLPQLLDRLHSGNALPVTAYDRSHTIKISEGTLQTVDNVIDTTTGTVKLKAAFANPDQKLFPNQFVNVDLLIDTLHDAILVPQSAIQRGAPGTFVYVIDTATDTVKVRPVTLGPSNPTNVVVSKGLEAGEMVVTDGADKLKDGAKITLPGQSAGQGGRAAAPQSGQQNGASGTQHHRHAGGQGQQSGENSQ